MVSAARRSGADGGRLLPDEPDHAAARAAVRGLAGNGVQGHPAAAAILRAQAGLPSRDAADQLWIVDGTLVPVRDRKVGASSRDYRFSTNLQVNIDADTRLVVATARPAPGNKAEALVGRNSGLLEQCQGVTVLGDGVYINIGLIVPHRKRPGRPFWPASEPT